MREPAAACRGLTRTITLLAVATAAACTGDGPTPAAPTAPPTVAVDSLPPVTAPPPTSAPALSVESDPTFRAGAVVAPGGGRQWLLLGTGREAAGAPRRLTIFASPDGAAWAPISVDAAEHTSAVAAYGRPDGSAVIAGTTDRDDGAHPTVWELRDGELSDPVVLEDVRGVATAIAPDADGRPVLLLATADGPAVASEPGGWTAALLPGGGEAVGIGVSASATVVTGTSIWRSTDGARSFEATPAAPVLGALIGAPGGFVAASCTTGGLVLSPDGRVWTDLGMLHPRGVVPVPGGGCGTIATDDEGGVWLAAVAGDPVVFRVRDQLVDRLGVPPRPPGTVFDGQPLVAAAGGTVVVAVPQPGGVATSTASSVTLTTELELDAAMTMTTGATPGHAAPVAVVPLDDRGQVAGVATYPVVTDGADGSYRWTTTLHAGAVDASGALVAEDGVAPVGPDGDLGGIVRIATGDVALATVDDADAAPGTAGAVGDVVLSRRQGGAWSAPDVVVGGPGRQAVGAVVATGDLAVGVGDQVTTDPAGTPVVVPLVVATNGTTTRTIPLDGRAQSLTAACPGPAGTVVAIGTDAAGASVVTTIDIGADLVTTVAGAAGQHDHRVRGQR